MDDIRAFLESHLRPLAGPYLFVGAGISLRYAHLPTWRGLLEHYADKTEMPFDYYLSAAGNSMPLAATKVAAAFHEVWFKSDEYKEAREAHDGPVDDIALPLKTEIAKDVQSALDAMDISSELLPEFDLLKNSTVDGVITTNYDRLMSLVFPDFQEFVGQDGLLFSDTQGIAEIYAIHGSTTDPRSLVLTEADYQAYERLNAYLAAKLMTIFVEHPVIFLGYSFNDPNIQTMLMSLVGGLQDRSVEKLQDRLIFVEWVEDAEPKVERTHSLVDGQLLPIIKIVVPNWVAVFEALGQREHALPARTLRVLKQQVYDIVLSNDPKGLLYAMSDIDSDDAKDISVVFGVGAKFATVGIVGLDRTDLIQDVLENPSRGYPAKEIVEKLLPHVPSTQWMPVFKYLREADHLTATGELKENTGLNAKVVARHKKMIREIKTSLPGITPVLMDELMAANDDAWIFARSLDLPAYVNDIEGIRAYLIGNASKYRINGWWAVQYAKAVIAYEYVRFGLQSP